MKDEIKEIINDLQRVADRKCYPEDILCGSIAQEWVDYITNLQEERNDYKDRFNLMAKFRDKALAREWEYKSRNEKAIEKLESTRILGIRSGKTWFSTLVNEIIDILNGSDEELRGENEKYNQSDD